MLLASLIQLGPIELSDTSLLDLHPVSCIPDRWIQRNWSFRNFDCLGEYIIYLISIFTIMYMNVILHSA